ncbi:MAG: sel1 repeat family protein, partial [Bacteroidales bacterium]|nr:sel1 repeat family protein [Bacteroidales bacterium]
SLTEAMKQQKDSEVQRQAEKSQTEGVVSGAEGDDEIKNEISTSDDDIQVGKANVFLKKGQYKEAVKIYKKIAMKGNAYAQGNYGNCLLHGWGVKQNMAKGIEWLEKSASQKGAWPCLKLAWVFLGYDFNGKRITLDNQKAKEYISKAKKYGGGDDGEISALEEAAARSVIVTNTKVIKDVKCNGKRGVVIELKMVAHGMRGRRLNFSAYTALLEDEFLKPGDLEFMSPDAPPQCCFVEIICPPKKVSVWHKYALFISYEDIYDHTFPNEIERLVLAAWDQTNENDVQLLCCKELGSFSLSFKRHTFRSNEWFFTFSEK